MTPYVSPHSIVRTIWGKSDTIIFIFAGAAAEFACNKAVDWLYFTGKLPQDPIGRLFSTVAYARQILFAPKDAAEQTIDKIRAIHGAVEGARGAAIPDWAYRDVLFMLIHYSIAAYELLERKLSAQEKEDVYECSCGWANVCRYLVCPLPTRPGCRYGKHTCKRNLTKSHYTTDLFRQYKRSLGAFRYHVLVEGQKLVVPPHVARLLDFGPVSLLTPVVPLYKWSRKAKLDGLIRKILLPNEHLKQIEALDVVPS